MTTLLGERLKGKGISYIGDNSSAILAADRKGDITSGEIEINYNKDWLLEKTQCPSLKFKHTYIVL